MIATINEIFFPIILFISIFSFACCLISTSRTQATEEIQRIDEFTNNIKEALSSTYDPEEDETSSDSIVTEHQDNTVVKQDVSVTSVVLSKTAKPSVKTETKHQQVKPNHETAQHSQLFNRMKIRDLRAYVREHNLQAAIKQACGKTISRCTKKEILEALSA